MTDYQRKWLIISLITILVLVGVFFAWRTWGPHSLSAPAKDPDDFEDKLTRAREHFGPYKEISSDGDLADFALAMDEAGYDYASQYPMVRDFFLNNDINAHHGKAILKLKALIDQYIDYRQNPGA